MKRSIAISDIHGCAKTFDRLLWDKIKLTKKDQLYLLGDYVNRGPDTKGVLDIIFYLQKKNYPLKLLKGNHDEIFIQALKNKNYRNAFIRYGGKQTLASFGVKAPSEIPSKYFELLKSTEYYIKTDRFLLVHAGFNFDNKNIFKDREAMLWARQMKVKKDKLKDRFIVHGHTPMLKETIQQQFKNKQIPQIVNIDCGCVYHPRLGSRLCALNLDSGKLYFSKNVEKA